jgi:hypothetical protein
MWSFAEYFQHQECRQVELPTTIRTHQKFNNIIHILGLKITKSTLLNQTW